MRQSEDPERNHGPHHMPHARRCTGTMVCNSGGVRFETVMKKAPLLLASFPRGSSRLEVGDPVGPSEKQRKKVDELHMQKTVISHAKKKIYDNTGLGARPTGPQLFPLRHF